MEVKICSLEFSPVPCTLASLAMFDKLSNAPTPIVRGTSGYLIPCAYADVAGVPVHSHLAELMLLGDESENAGA
jgi:hypothetical protein